MFFVIKSRSESRKLKSVCFASVLHKSLKRAASVMTQRTRMKNPRRLIRMRGKERRRVGDGNLTTLGIKEDIFIFG